MNTNIRSLIRHSKLLLNTNSYDYTIHNGTNYKSIYFKIPNSNAHYNLESFIKHWQICYIPFNINVIETTYFDTFIIDIYGISFNANKKFAIATIINLDFDRSMFKTTWYSIK